MIIIILCVNPFSFLSVLKPAGSALHDWCLQAVQTAQGEDALTPIYSALLCGERLTEGNLKQTFVALGIIHLMVISGAHLIFLEKAWSLLPSFRFKDFFITLFLLIYSMSAGLNPPVVRALFSLLTARLSRKLKLFWGPYWRIQISGLLCLIFQSGWFHSLSLQLSWTASLGMSNHRISRLNSCVLTFILILPIVSQWGGLHPLSIILNWLITPLASCILLPLSMLIIPFPFIRPVTDFLWQCFLRAVGTLRPFMENKGIELAWSFNSFEIWIYICAVSVLLQLYLVYSLRRDCDFKQTHTKKT